MLEELIVENLGVIERAELGLGEGMTVITGETGAGKTMLVGALQMALGARTDPRLIREGASQAVVEARFVLDGEEFVVSRTLSAQGRSRGYVNGKMASVAELAELGRRAVDVHGQHAQMRLESAAAQLTLLDGFSGIDLGPRDQIAERLSQLARRIAEARTGIAERERELAVVRFELGEIDRVSPIDAEEDLRLEEELDVLEREEEFRETYLSLLAAVSGDEGDAGAVAELSHLARRLHRESATAELAARLDGVVIELNELAHVAQRRLEGLSGDPGRPDEIRSRLIALRDLKKRFGPTLADVLEARQTLASRLGELSGEGASPEALEAQAAALRTELEHEETRIRGARLEAAAKVAAAVNLQLPLLSFTAAEFSVQLAPKGDGSPAVFMFRPHPGSRPLEIARFASGGELSRLMLGLALVMGVEAETQLFDEVDAGVGGRSARDIAQALKRLSATRQVLVVTHLAQVAAVADRHFTITKRIVGAGTATEIAACEGEKRVGEVARMLAGDPDSATARKHSAELLEEGGGRSWAQHL